MSGGGAMSEIATPTVALPRGPEWGTFALMIGCYAAWGAVVFGLAAISVWLAIPAAAVLGALHSSLTHEALHGHPFRTRWLNEAVMALPLTLFIPYGRFRDLHLAHHRDESLTDPYDDPESNYMDPAVWSRLPAWLQWVLRGNNTLAGRVLLGPLIGQALFMAGDWRAVRAGDRAVLSAWLLHIPGMAAVLALVALSPMPVWGYILTAYLALGIVKIRTFLEHRAHEAAPARTVIVEDRGALAFLFLNNNLHVVHHTHPGVPWHRLPALYRAHKSDYLARNRGYAYRSYAEVFRHHLWRAKDPVPHPLWPRR